jgi:hypothetical protein
MTIASGPAPADAGNPKCASESTSLGAAAAATLTGTAGCGGATGAWRFFKDQEACTLEAILERLIPEDDGPGARQAGVIHYIGRQLA